jgi:hypothetical protein
MDQPKIIVNHQRVNARLTFLRVTATGAAEKFAGISGAARKARPLPDATGDAFLRHFAPLSRAKRRRNRRFSTVFRPKIGGRIAKMAKKPAGADTYAESTDATKV